MRRWLWALLLVLAICCSAIGNLRLAQTQVLGSGAGYWFGATLLLAGAALLDRREALAVTCRPWCRADLLALTTIGIVAAVMRLWGLAGYPPADALAYEEGQIGAKAYTFVQAGWFPLEYPLTHFAAIIGFLVGGVSSLAFRLPFVVASITAPLFLFLALRRFLSLPAAWATATLLAGSRYAALVGRFAFENFFPISVVALAFWLFVRALQRRDSLDSLAFALVSTDLLYEYAGYKTLPIVAVVAAFWVALSRWRRGGLEAGALRHFVLVVAVWLVLLGPGVVVSWYWGGFLWDSMARHVGTGERTAAQIIDTGVKRLPRALGLFVWFSPEPWANIPGEPMFDGITSVLATLGFFAAVWHWRDPWRLTAVATFAFPFVTGTVLPFNLDSTRYFLMAVPLFTIVGFFLDDLWSMRFARPTWRFALLCGLVTASVFVNGTGLRRLMASPAAQAAFDTPDNLILAAVRAAPPGARVILLARHAQNAFGDSDYNWFVQHIDGVAADALRDTITLALAEHGRPLYWVVEGEPEDRLAARLVAALCPGAATESFRSGPAIDVSQVRILVDSAGRCGPLRPPGLRVEYAVRDERGQTRRTSFVDPAISSYTIPATLAEDLAAQRLASLDVEWSGAVHAPAAGRYRVRLELVGASGHLRVGRVDVAARGGDTTAGDRTVEVNLGANRVPLSVTLHAQAGAWPQARLFWTPPGQSEELLGVPYLEPKMPNDSLSEGDDTR